MNTKIFLVIFISVFGLFILISVISYILESNGMPIEKAIGPRGETAAKIIFFIMFCIMGFSMVPLAVRFFVHMQVKIGNSDLFLVKFLLEHERGVVLGVWVFFAIGLCIALMGAIKDGFFK
jgi:hypothetical protein